MSPGDQTQFSCAVLAGIAVLTLLLWFLWKQRIELTAWLVIRHLAFNLCVYLGMLWFLYQDRITVLIFGHVVAKGSREEIPAGFVILGGVVFWFGVGVISLGRNRRVEFMRYVETFNSLRRRKK